MDEHGGAVGILHKSSCARLGCRIGYNYRITSLCLDLLCWLAASAEGEIRDGEGRRARGGRG